jgi:integrase
VSRSALCRALERLGKKAEPTYQELQIAVRHSRQGFFERGEFLAFRAALPEYLQPVVTFAYFTGWRRGEVLGLKWNQVDLAAKSVRIEGDSTKNKKARTVAVVGELLEAVQGQWESARLRRSPANPLLCFARMSSTKMESRLKTSATHGLRRLSKPNSVAKCFTTSGERRSET